MKQQKVLEKQLLLQEIHQRRGGKTKPLEPTKASLLSYGKKATISFEMGSVELRELKQQLLQR
ncbi:MAG: hypothetical protein IGR92_08695 [Leptolyngbyaceae cyanobacterium T60_A2020_046]|nr:hypothetical protein [Leptolyngbyaceae cyanobacterium T60_A2020_046]